MVPSKEALDALAKALRNRDDAARALNNCQDETELSVLFDRLHRKHVCLANAARRILVNCGMIH